MTKTKKSPSTERPPSVEQKIAEFIRMEFPDMPEKTAALWARMIEIDERERIGEGGKEENTPLDPLLTRRITETRQAISKHAEKEYRERVRKNYRESLIHNDSIEALTLLQEAKKSNIDLSDIEATTETKLDLAALKRGDVPFGTS